MGETRAGGIPASLCISGNLAKCESAFKEIMRSKQIQRRLTASAINEVHSIWKNGEFRKECKKKIATSRPENDALRNIRLSSQISCTAYPSCCQCRRRTKCSGSPSGVSTLNTSTQTKNREKKPEALETNNLFPKNPTTPTLLTQRDRPSKCLHGLNLSIQGFSAKSDETRSPISISDLRRCHDPHHSKLRSDSPL